MAGRVLIVANWKMNPASFRDARRLLDATKKAAERATRSHVVIAPPAIYLRDLRAAYHGTKLSFALQHGHFEASGAYTGETSLSQAKDAGASYVIVGHAERRERGETDEHTGKNVAAALALKMTPVLCVGERERTPGGEHFALVKQQLRAGFADVSPAQLARVIVTYEPLWTIGRDTTMNPRDMHEMAIFIRKTIVDFKGEQGMKLKILYGGSIEAKNALSMLEMGDVQGLLVGRSSEEPARMANLLHTIEGEV